MPLGLALKQQTGSGSPVDGGGLGGWFGPNATIVDVGGIWNGSGLGGNLNQTCCGATSGGVESRIAPAGFNGLNAVGTLQSTQFGVSMPQFPIPVGSIDFSSPGNAMTVYVVMQMTDIGSVFAAEPAGSLFGYGYDIYNGTFTRMWQFNASFDATSAGGNPALILEDRDGPTPTGNSYRGVYPLPVQLAGGATGIMVVQTQRSGGHRFRWQRDEIGPFSDISIGTVGAFTGPDVWSLCGRYAEEGGLAVVRTANAFIGHVFAYAALHDDSQIAQMESYLGGIWGV